MQVYRCRMSDLKSWSSLGAIGVACAWPIAGFAGDAPASRSAPFAVAQLGCRSPELDLLRGQKTSDATSIEDLIPKARQASGAGVVQVLRPGDKLPFVYQSNRLMIQLDADGRVGRAWCG